MSLAPEEQRTLARIEDWLCRSDPRLASMLATFTVRSTRRRIPLWKGLCLGWFRIKRIGPVGLATALAVALLGGLLLTHASQPSCTPRSGSVSAFRQITGCQPGGSSSRHSNRAAGNSGITAPSAPEMASSR